MLNKDLDNNIDIQKYLYIRGFLITDDKNIDTLKYPFYRNWYNVNIGNYDFYINNDQKLYLYKSNNKIYFIIGHAYDPFTNEYKESNILKYISKADKNGLYYNTINELTGVFVAGYIKNENEIYFYGDAACMMSTFYGTHDNKLYISSHTQLIGDLCNLEFDEFVKELLQYKYYDLFGRCLPGDLSPYNEFKRIIPNFEYSYKNGRFSWKRFYMTDKVNIASSNKDYENIINECYKIMCDSLKLIPKKWKHPAISLTGGCDSKTTLSCVENFNEYDYFSYISVKKERPDAEAAHKIAKMLGINHNIYEIPSDLKNYPKFDLVEKILRANCGNIGKVNVNDIKKRMYFADNEDFDVEVKSWVSEVARAYYHKRFAKKKMPQNVTPRILTSIYKVFINNRTLAKKVDKIFEEYLSKYYTNQDFENIEWYDLIFWEYRVAAWNGLVITGEHQYSFDITIPYNNRILLRYLLSTPLQYRIADKPHKDIQKKGNRKIANTNISVQNVKHTPKRAMAEKVYFNISSKVVI